MTVERVKFERDYNHDWPSGAQTRFRNNWEGPVKAEVAAAAVAAGAARRTRVVDPTEPPAPKRKRRSRAKPGARRSRPPAANSRPVEGVKGGHIDQAQPEPRLPGNLDPALAEPQALAPNLADAEPPAAAPDEAAAPGAESDVDEPTVSG